jgi:enediyne biosynthesis protein E4
VSQPFDRSCEVPAPGTVDEGLGEFWVENPWEIAREHNLSAYERNRTFWNVEGRDFIDISRLTAMDSEGDGRSAVGADFNNDGRLDLVVRQAGGGPLTFFENRFPQRHWLRVSLRGHQSNRLGIGARLIATVGKRQVVRDLLPVNSYMSQTPALVHFGLGDDPRIDRLLVKWPSGKIHELTDIAADGHILIDEAQGTIESLIPASSMAP